MMRKLILLLAVTLLGVTDSEAQLLYRVTAPGQADKASYLFGTHHVAPAAMIDSVHGLREALEACSVMYGEVDADELLDPASRQTLEMMLMAPADSTVSMMLTKPQRDSLSVMLAKYVDPMATLDMVDMLKPMAVSAQLQIAQSMRDFPGFDPGRQLDMELQRIAREAGKKVKGLESAMWQMQLLYGAPIADQVRDLLKMMAQDEQVSEYTHRLAEAYKAQDLAAVHSLLTDPVMGMDADEQDRLVDSRNIQWADLLAGIIPTGSILICVGAGHLLGDNGMIALLGKAGFNVDPVN